MKIEVAIGSNDFYKSSEILALSKETNKMLFFIYTDIFGRRFKLEPVTNENIKFPFIITPLGDEK